MGCKPGRDGSGNSGISHHCDQGDSDARDGMVQRTAEESLENNSSSNEGERKGGLSASVGPSMGKNDNASYFTLSSALSSEPSGGINRQKDACDDANLNQPCEQQDGVHFPSLGQQDGDGGARVRVNIDAKERAIEGNDKEDMMDLEG